LKYASKIYGVAIGDPTFITVSSKKNAEGWIDEIEKNYDQNKKPQIIIFLFNKK
jgi:hypothetical protein